MKKVQGRDVTPKQFDYKPELQKDTKCYSYDFQTDKKSPVHVTKINYVLSAILVTNICLDICLWLKNIPMEFYFYFIFLDNFSKFFTKPTFAFGITAVTFFRNSRATSSK